MADQLPAIIPPGALTAPADTYIVPALIAPRTTKLYDRTKDRLTQDEVERIRL